MISYPHYLNYSFLSFLELKKYHLSYQITQITKIVNLFQEQNDKIVTIVTNIIHGFFSVWKKLAHIEPCLGLPIQRLVCSHDNESDNNDTNDNDNIVFKKQCFSGDSWQDDDDVDLGGFTMIMMMITVMLCRRLYWLWW